MIDSTSSTTLLAVLARFRTLYKLAYGDPGHPGFAATLIRSAIHRKLVIYQLLDIIIATQYTYSVELKLLLQLLQLQLLFQLISQSY
jgi:hypothetical protein